MLFPTVAIILRSFSFSQVYMDREINKNPKRRKLFMR